MKRSVLFLLAVTFILSISGITYAAPEAMPVTLGISPRDVAADTSDIFRTKTSGIPNVGVGETIYLGQKPAVGHDEPVVITGYTWAITAAPRNSQAALSATDEAVVRFVPDLAGTYRFSLVVDSDSGQSEAAILTVNAANWVGVGTITGQPNVPKCAGCHAGQLGEGTDKVSQWQETNHSDALARKLDGEAGFHFGPNCVSCHATGYNKDETAVNNGFDDRAAQEEWVFLDSAAGGLVPGTWDSMKVHFPETAGMANIQCEMCHGPGSAHMGNTNDNKIYASFDYEVCAQCHDSGTHHYRPMQWELSLHSHPVDESGRASCAPCHTGMGFVDNLEGLPAEELRTDYVPITCVTCHDPHDATNAHQLRTVEPYELLNGEVYNAGLSNICVNCHHSRTVNTAAAEAPVMSRYYGPHYGAQSEMLKGTNAFDMGGQVENSPHYMVVENGCVGCHMAPTPNDRNDPDKYLILGDHTFSMKTEDGAEHVEVCATCHGEVESFDAILTEDWDGDETAEGTSAEIEGLMERLAMALPPVGEPTIQQANWFTPAQRQAYWNYKFVLYDRSMGMHNAKYTKSILLNAINADLGVEPVEGNIPAKFNLSDAYPNPFNPIAAFKYDLANDGKVDIRVFDMAGREIRTVVSDNQKAGSYKAVVDLTGRPSGVYVLRMHAGSFDASTKLVLVK